MSHGSAFHEAEAVIVKIRNTDGTEWEMRFGEPGSGKRVNLNWSYNQEFQEVYWDSITPAQRFATGPREYTLKMRF